MTTFRKVFIEAIVKQLLRGKSLIQAILAFWITPAALNGKPRTVERTKAAPPVTPRRIQDFLKEAEDLLLEPLGGDGLIDMSAALKAQFLVGLKTSMASMLPSYNHQLPKGHETGQYLALDVGGSTLRVALVELRGREAKGREMEIVRMSSFRINQDVKNLEGMAFFVWMADRILETIKKEDRDSSRPMPMALAWSFPIEQTSLKGGRIQVMGKGFQAANGLMGQDLGEVIQIAALSKGLKVEVEVILNDGGATLLSAAYTQPTTRFGLILGTGVNIAAYLPVSAIGRPKFGDRPAAWLDAASHVIVNTELGMFGKDILPVTRWDLLLRAVHPTPELQPLEHLVSGFYLGEVARLALLEAIQTTGVFGGVVPKSLTEPYSLDTETLSIIETDSSPTLETAIQTFATLHPSPHTPTASDLAVLRSLASFISRRSSAVVACCVYTLWAIRLEHETTAAESRLQTTSVAFNGSVIENYPRYRANCQEYVDTLLRAGGEAEGGRRIALVPAKESSLLGAAVASACAVDGAL